MPTQSRSPEPAEVIRGAIGSRLWDVHTAVPALVIRYDPVKKQCDCRPLLKDRVRQPDGSVIAQYAQPIFNVPVVLPGGGAWRSEFTLSDGTLNTAPAGSTEPLPADTVLLVFAHGRLDNWKAAGGDVDPGDPRRFDRNDAIAIPGLRPADGNAGTTGPWSRTIKTWSTGDDTGQPAETDPSLGDSGNSVGAEQGPQFFWNAREKCIEVSRTDGDDIESLQTPTEYVARETNPVDCGTLMVTKADLGLGAAPVVVDVSWHAPGATLPSGGTLITFTQLWGRIKPPGAFSGSTFTPDGTEPALKA